MAVGFYEGETVLPPKLLAAGDDVPPEKPNIKHLAKGSSSESVSHGTESCGSLSSGFSTPRGSELGSIESTESDDDDDFIAELTRQMADYMLEEDDDDENTAPKSLSQNSKKGFSEKRPDCNLTSRGLVDKSSNNPDSGFSSNKGFTDGQKSKIDGQLNEDGVGVPVCWGRGGKMGGSSQRKQHHKKQRQLGMGGAGGFANGGRGLVLGSPAAGSGMRAIFLGGSGSRYGSNGTGVFLPVGASDTGRPRKKPGCSTVLIPTRVLEALQLHFNRMDAMSQSNGPTPHTWRQDAEGSGVPSQQKQPQTESAVSHPEVKKLPQEWTY